MADQIQYSEVEQRFKNVVADARRVKLASLRIEPWATVESAQTCLEDSISAAEDALREALAEGRAFLVKRIMILFNQCAEPVREACDAIIASRGDPA